MSEDTQSKPVKTTHRIRGLILHVALLLVAFLAGFIWMGLKYRECSSSLSPSEMENALASATIDARRGDLRQPV